VWCLPSFITAGEARQFAVVHPEILVKTPVKRQSGFTPTRDAVYGIKSKWECFGLTPRFNFSSFGVYPFCRESEDFTALIQARFTTFSPETEDYPDLSNMKIKGVRSVTSSDQEELSDLTSF
jgi:hypothetical protein